MCQTVKTTDIFKAAYLFFTYTCELSIAYYPELGTVFTLSGDRVTYGEQEYINPDTMVFPLSYKEAVLCLMERSGLSFKRTGERIPNMQPVETET